VEIVSTGRNTSSWAWPRKIFRAAGNASTLVKIPAPILENLIGKPNLPSPWKSRAIRLNGGLSDF